MRSSSYNNEIELLACIAKGDQAAFSVLFEELKDKVYSFAFHFTHSQFSAEEITQDVFVKLWTGRQSLGAINSIEAWTITITKNLCFNHLKKRAAELKAITALAEKDIATEENVDEYIFYKDQLGVLQAALDQLSPQQRVIFRLNREQGLKNEEIAQQLNLATNTVKTHMVAALNKIRKFMQTHPVSLFIASACLLKFILQ